MSAVVEVQALGTLDRLGRPLGELQAELIDLRTQGVALVHDARQFVVAGSGRPRSLADRLFDDGGVV